MRPYPASTHESQDHLLKVQCTEELLQALQHEELLQALRHRVRRNHTIPQAHPHLIEHMPAQLSHPHTPHHLGPKADPAAASPHEQHRLLIIQTVKQGQNIDGRLAAAVVQGCRQACVGPQQLLKPLMHEIL